VAPTDTRPPASSNRLDTVSTPFWTILVLGVVGLLCFSVFLIVSLNRQAIATSEQVFQTALTVKKRTLSQIAMEYGYWDDAVEHLVDTLDRDWIETNLATYIQDELNVYGLHVLDETGDSRLDLLADPAVQVGPQALYGADLSILLRQATAVPNDQAPVATTAIMGDVSRLFLVSAVRLTTYTHDTITGTAHVLVLSQELSSETLAALGEEYDLPGLKVSDRAPGPLAASLEIRGADDALLGYFTWSSPLPGMGALPKIALALLVFFAMMFVTASVFLRRTTAMISALETAQAQARAVNTFLAQELLTDALTGLGNRRALDRHLTGIDGKPVRERTAALLYVDLDHFKAVNDTHGHETGDRILRHTADILRRLAPEAAIYRLGGDEFVLIFETASRESVLASAQSLVDALRKPFSLTDCACLFSASIGIAFHEDTANLLRQADNALYAAKRDGKGRFVVAGAEDATRDEAPRREPPRALERNAGQ